MKTTTLTVAAAAIVMFALSASAREHHHGHHHHYHHMAASRAHLGKLDRLVRRCQMDCLALPRRMRPSIGPYRRTMAATKRGRLRGAVGRCGDWSGVIPVRATTPRGPRESALWSCGRTTSGRSSVNKTANGSSNPATMTMRFAPALARSRARLRSVGLITLRHDPEKWIPVVGKDHAHSTS
jgi:hypothetical protein